MPSPPKNSTTPTIHPITSAAGTPSSAQMRDVRVASWGERLDPPWWISPPPSAKRREAAPRLEALPMGPPRHPPGLLGEGGQEAYGADPRHEEVGTTPDVHEPRQAADASGRVPPGR